MTEHHDTYTFLDTQDAWDAILPRLLTAEAVAVDIEGNGFHRYPEQTCLIQLADSTASFLLDPFALRDLSGLGRLLADPAIVKIFHCCEYDVRSLIRDYNFYTRNIFDTSVAAHFLGATQLGLGATLKNFLNIEIPKTKSLQRQDWTLRPLSEEAMWYAAGDVYFLPRLRQHLQAELEAKQRWAWVQEEFELLEKLEYVPPEPVAQSFWRIKGSRLLKPRQRAVLRELHLFRDQWAREANRPPFKMISNEILLAIAQDPDVALSQIKGLGHLFRHGKGPGLAEAIRKGQQAEPVHLPRPPARRHGERDPEGGKRLDALKAWRIRRGGLLELDPALLWPMAGLQALANEPELLQSQAALAGSESGVRHWQWAMFSHELQELLAHLELEREIGVT